MTLDLDNLRKLEAAATARPWMTHRPGAGAGDHICGWSGSDDDSEGPAGGFYSTGPSVWSKEAALADAALIAAARNALPALLADHARLVAEVERVTAAGRLACADAIAARAEVARLERLVDAWETEAHEDAPGPDLAAEVARTRGSRRPWPGWPR